MGSLTKLERSIIIGSLLGDGYVRIMPGRSDAFLEINHSIKAKDYVDYKFKKLKRICESAPKERVSGDNRRACRFFTKQHKDLTNLYYMFYKNGRKIIPKDIDIDPISIAIWYMDDGSKCRDGDIYLNTQQFSLNDQKILLNCLRKLGINARLNRDKKYHRIRILKESIKGFMDIIKPFVAPSMKYKLVMTP
ncbi:MAG: LAGLIDADG homing endonuclease [Parcubacteria group bacterium GW2011_GWF2_40_10]|nr:MAG: LAGLIDADG homing endonuclease [Parcubacteria group bacterium GW2011_GWF2_40_10]KKR76143.1 MAG: LAGLIDADG homing endonuclease [Parcubacteria group bacterium GW2011_GWE2_40_8]